MRKPSYNCRAGWPVSQPSSTPENMERTKVRSQSQHKLGLVSFSACTAISLVPATIILSHIYNLFSL